jgi:anthranilate synthase component 1
MVVVPDRQTFHALARQGDLIPVYREILADVDTPVSAFFKLRDCPYAFLLESVEGGERIGRWSFLGTNPEAVLRTRGGAWELLRNGVWERGELGAEDPLHRLRDLLASETFVPHGDLPPFLGGAVGYMAYDLVRFFERLPDRCADDLALPDAWFLLTDTCIAFDRVLNRAKVIAMARVGEDGVDAAYHQACAKIEDLIARLRRPAMPPAPPAPAGPLEVRSNYTRAQYEAMVLAAKEYIAAGDIIQVVPSQRFEAETEADPFDIYRALRSINPSPYMFYLQLDGTHLCGSSPEILVTEHQGRVRTRPIAGTRRRGVTPEQDKALEVELLADEKERAEHIMLVDLGRNDLGRVCNYGSVEVDEYMVVERYSHVMHIVSNVVGRLRRDQDAFDVLRACFPAGTLTGAPKIRAMEIIDELEPTRRGAYGGAIGYFSYNGSMDTCITIRTAVLRDGKCWWQAGGGVVADSDPGAEYDEACNKAMAMRRALEMAARGLE